MPSILTTGRRLNFRWKGAAAAAGDPPPCRRGGGERATCSNAENLCHQVIFVEDAASAVTPLDPEMIQVSNAVGQGAERRGLVQGSVRPVRVAEVLVLAQHDHQVALVPDQCPVQ